MSGYMISVENFFLLMTLVFLINTVMVRKVGKKDREQLRSLDNMLGAMIQNDIKSFEGYTLCVEQCNKYEIALQAISGNGGMCNDDNQEGGAKDGCPICIADIALGIDEKEKDNGQ